MKFLAQDSHTRYQLQNWAAAAGRKLVLVNFYFWISGTTLQKSVEGLYRAILWEALKQCPDLVPDVLPSRWKSAENEDSRLDHLPLSFSEIQQAFGLLRTFLGSRYALCLFIDGLDEFDGDHWKLGNELASWKSDHVKICVSARPYNGFQKTLPLNSSRHFRLHELNREDMQEHTRRQLLKDERFCQLQDQDPSSTQAIVASLAEKAEGVFLWTVLAIKFILQGLTSQYSAKQLLNMLSDDIPQGLEAMFIQMFDRIPQPEQRQAAISLLVMSDPLMNESIDPEYDYQQLGYNLIFHWYIEQTIQDMARHDAGQAVRTSRLNLQQSHRTEIEAAKTRLNSRCANFIIWTDDESRRNFEIAHRTLGDFLRQPATQSRLQVLSGDVNLDLLLSKTCLNVVRDFGCSQTHLPLAWPAFWEIVGATVRIADRSGDDMEFLDKMALSIFDLRRTVPGICVRTDLRGFFLFQIYHGQPIWHQTSNFATTMYIEYDVGLVQVLCRLIFGKNWNFIARTKKQLIGFIPERARTVLILATALSALSDPKEQRSTGACDLAEFFLEMGTDLNQQVPSERSFDSGRHALNVWAEAYDPNFLLTILLGSTPSIWEVLLLTFSTEILSNPKASCETAFKMIELFLKYGASQEMWLLVGRPRELDGDGPSPRLILPVRLHRISLQQLVEVRRPTNSDEIWRHLRRAKSNFVWPFSRLRGSLGNLKISCLTDEELEDLLVPLAVMDSHRLENLGNDIAFACMKQEGDHNFLAFDKEARGSRDVVLDYFRIMFH